MDVISKIVQVRLVGFQYSSKAKNVCSMILEEVGGERKMPIVIGENEAASILAAVQRAKLPRPITHDLMARMISLFGYKMKKMLIYSAKDDVFASYLYFCKEKDESEIDSSAFNKFAEEFGMEEYVKIDARTSDAIALALRCGSPIYVCEDILESKKSELMPFDLKEGRLKDVSEISDFSELTDEWLNKYLRDALQREDFETAIKIREELKRR